MIVHWREWYLARSLREQRLLLLMAAIGIPMLIWLLIVMPLNRAYDAALDQHVEAIDRNGRVKMMAALPKSRVPAGLAAGSDLSLTIAESAGAAGIPIENNTADGPNAVNVAISAASATAILQWLREMEARGITVDDLRLSPSADGSASATARLARAQP